MTKTKAVLLRSTTASLIGLRRQAVSVLHLLQAAGNDRRWEAQHDPRGTSVKNGLTTTASGFRRAVSLVRIGFRFQPCDSGSRRIPTLANVETGHDSHEP